MEALLEKQRRQHSAQIAELQMALDKAQRAAEEATGLSSVFFTKYFSRVATKLSQFTIGCIDIKKQFAAVGQCTSERSSAFEPEQSNEHSRCFSIQGNGTLTEFGEVRKIDENCRNHTKI